MQKQLTIRGLEGELARRVRALARAEGISLNQAVLKLLRIGSGLEEQPGARTIGHALDDLVGTWSEEQAREFDEAVRDLESIDEEIWK
jgi:hypothetical protein